MRELLPTEEISRGLGAPVPLQYLPRNELDKERQAIDALTFTPIGGKEAMSWEESLYANYTDGMLILHKGRVVYERYFGCLDEDGKHAAMSMTKSLATSTLAATPRDPTQLDRRVEKFLDSREGTWHDLNVPAVDGRTLRDLIIKNGFRNALEIGTSTGHSAIWIAWGLSKTGGKLTTIEIDPARHQTALANFKEAGLSDFIDARLADAHELVPRLAGPFDFVFSDADKAWYTKYFDAVWPKLPVGGCFTAHNVSMRMSGIAEFLDHLEAIKDGRTTIDEKSRARLSITCKTGEMESEESA